MITMLQKTMTVNQSFNTLDLLLNSLDPRSRIVEVARCRVGKSSLLSPGSVHIRGRRRYKTPEHPLGCFCLLTILSSCED
jgi:hypothetical protein